MTPNEFAESGLLRSIQAMALVSPAWPGCAPLSPLVAEWVLTSPRSQWEGMFKRAAAWAGGCAGLIMDDRRKEEQRTGVRSHARTYASDTWRDLAFTCFGALSTVGYLEAMKLLVPTEEDMSTLVVPSPEQMAERWAAEDAWDNPDGGDVYEDYEWGGSHLDFFDEEEDEDLSDAADAHRNPPDSGVGHALHGPGFPDPVESW